MNIKNKFQNKFWSGKKVLITGHNGFKGSWLSLLLLTLGADIFGISLENDDPISLFNRLHLSNLIIEKHIDIRNSNEIKKNINKFSPDIIFHLAAQPLVNEGYVKPIETWTTNVMGTISILEGVRELNKKIILIAITTDKVYQNNDWVYGYRENDRLGGDDPYSSSKSAAELAINCWEKSFYKNSRIIVSSARAGNVIGGGDYADNRIVPDIFRSLEKNKILKLRNPESTRPWQHVLEPLWGYIKLAEKMNINPEMADCYNFGPNSSSNRSVLELVNEFKKIIKFDFVVDHNSNFFKESKYLHLISEKAERKLNWNQVWNFEETIRRTAFWYNEIHENSASELSLCMKDISDFIKLQVK